MQMWKSFCEILIKMRGWEKAVFFPPTFDEFLMLCSFFLLQAVYSLQQRFRIFLPFFLIFLLWAESKYSQFLIFNSVFVCRSMLFNSRNSFVAALATICVVKWNSFWKIIQQWDKEAELYIGKYLENYTVWYLVLSSTVLRSKALKTAYHYLQPNKLSWNPVYSTHI